MKTRTTYNTKSKGCLVAEDCMQPLLTLQNIKNLRI